MQNEKYLRHPNLDEMKFIFQEAGSLIKMVTIAPELPGGLELISHLKEQGVGLPWLIPMPHTRKQSWLLVRVM